MILRWCVQVILSAYHATVGGPLKLEFVKIVAKHNPDLCEVIMPHYIEYCDGALTIWINSHNFYGLCERYDELMMYTKLCFGNHVDLFMIER